MTCQSIGLWRGNLDNPWWAERLIMLLLHLLHAETPVQGVTPHQSQSPPCKQICTQREAYKHLSIFPSVVYILNFIWYFQVSHIKQNVFGESDVRERRDMAQDEKGWGSIIVEYGTRMWALDPRPYVSYVFLKQTGHPA